MRRCAVSLPSNIAEGQGRLSHLEFRRFLSNALGSLAELETQITLSTDFGFISSEEGAHVEKLAGQVGKLINGLISSINAREERRNDSKDAV